MKSRLAHAGADYETALLGFGRCAQIADTDEGFARGEMDDRRKALSRVIGRPTTTLAAAFALPPKAPPRS